MQKKKKYYEIKDGGVTLYWDMVTNTLVDIDVQPGVKTVNLFTEKTASQYQYSIYRIMLDKVYKQFPDVEELHIGDDISSIVIRNDMFQMLSWLNQKATDLLMAHQCLLRFLTIWNGSF